MAKKIKITSYKFIEVSGKIISKMTPSHLEYINTVLIFAAVAAELFGDEDEEEEIKITSDKFIEVGAKITSETASSFIEYIKTGLIFAAVAAELFGDEDEEEKDFINLFEKDVDDMRYSIYTGGDVCKEDFVLMKEKISAKNVVYTRRFKTFSDAMKALKAEIS